MSLGMFAVTIHSNIETIATGWVCGLLNSSGGAVGQDSTRHLGSINFYSKQWILVTLVRLVDTESI